MLFKISSPSSSSSCRGTAGGECEALMPPPPAPSSFSSSSSLYERNLPPILSPEVAASQLGSCSLLLLNLPSSPLTSSSSSSPSSPPPPPPKVGLDCALWTIGPNFSGVKCIQPGCHFLYSLPSSSTPSRLKVSSEGRDDHDEKDEGSGEKNSSSAFECLYTSMKVDDVVGECLDNTQKGIRGEFIYFSPHSVCVRRWNPLKMRFEKLKDEEEEERYRRAVRRLEMDRYLGVYPQQYVPMWSVLTDWISRSCLERIEPLQKIFSPFSQPVSEAEEKLLGGSSGHPSKETSTVKARQKGKGEQEKMKKERNDDRSSSSSSSPRGHEEEQRDIEMKEEGDKEGDKENEDEEEEEEDLDKMMSSGIERFYFTDIPSIQKTALSIALQCQLQARKRGASPAEAIEAASRVLTIEAMDGSSSLLSILEQVQEELNTREGEEKDEEKEEGESEEDQEKKKKVAKENANRRAADPPHMNVQEDSEETNNEEEEEKTQKGKEKEEEEKEESMNEEGSCKGDDIYRKLIEEEKVSWRRIRKRTWRNLLGEFQLSYIAFLLAHRYDAFEQWKKLLQLLCQSERAVYRLPEMYLSLIRVVYCQLEQCPSEFLEDALLQKSFLTSSALSLVVVCSGLTHQDRRESPGDYLNNVEAAEKTRSKEVQSHPEIANEGEEERGVDKRQAKKKEKHKKMELLQQIEERAGWLRQLLEKIMPRTHEKGDQACEEFLAKTADPSLLFLDEEDQPIIVDEEDLKRAEVSIADE
ncbi:aar2 protein [Cystoisospora suis]|uniref:Aar2 protein n=1 Tax=Cystoisospora suis TaxID=483139 RepID=A0A2C6KFE3_9APIC|nr:aar2 protein [Cystoisospora suis]